MIKKLPMYGLLLAVGVSCQTQKAVPEQTNEDTAQNKTQEDIKPYNEVITSEATSDEGLFTTHFVGDKLYFEIPLEMLEKDMLLVSRIAGVPAGFGGGYVNAGSKANEQVVRWEKRDNHIDMKVISFENESEEDSPIYQSVAANNFFPILFSSKIAAYNDDKTSVVIEVSDLFKEEVTAINGVSPELRKRYKVKKLDQSRSYITSANAFPENIEVKHVMTYEAEE
ncbi:MAG TPA: DUF5117 domain-containing protein, partial [Salegentibacter sp.]|nr:DUF5117 domain-containing protein [Salegentibacter sp.]